MSDGILVTGGAGFVGSTFVHRRLGGPGQDRCPDNNDNQGRLHVTGPA